MGSIHLRGGTGLFGSDEEACMDAGIKTIAYQREMAEWLWRDVWGYQLAGASLFIVVWPGFWFLLHPGRR